MAKKTLMAKVEMTSRFGVLKVLNVNDEQQLFIGRQPLSMSNHSLGIKEKWEIGKKDIFLVSSDSGGNFCPILYSLITVEKLLVNVSAPFGNCGDWLKVKRLGDRIILRFDRWNRENPAVLVKFDGGVISEGRRTVNVTKLARLCPRHGKI